MANPDELPVWYGATIGTRGPGGTPKTQQPEPEPSPPTSTRPPRITQFEKDQARRSGNPIGTGGGTADGYGLTLDLTDTVTKAVEEAIGGGSIPVYNTTRVEDYNWVASRFAEAYDVNKSDLRVRINGLAELWKQTYGGGQRFPTGPELFSWDVAVNSITTFASGMSALPNVFGIIGEDGRAVYYLNDPTKGIVPAVGNIPYSPRGAPVYTQDEFNQLRGVLAPTSGSGRGSSGSGTGRTTQVWDRRELSQAVTEKYRSWLLEEADDALVNQWVTEYTNEANAFWMAQAGRLDFDSFLTEKLRSTKRYQTLYQKKPEFQTEGEYLAGFRNVTSGYGLSGRVTQRELEAGMGAGQSTKGFAERVGSIREVYAGNQGTFSQKFAQKMADTGIGKT